MLRCVIDTNVIVSGIIIPQGYPYKTLIFFNDKHRKKTTLRVRKFSVNNKLAIPKF